MNQPLAKQHTLSTRRFDNAGSNTLRLFGLLMQKILVIRANREPQLFMNRC
jgi:hypothetical protein